jgi:hypothetical protein
MSSMENKAERGRTDRAALVVAAAPEALYRAFQDPGAYLA